MKKNTTKRSLLASVMALVMCVTMLVGTTFAWFTDTASTGVNKIQAGNLDVALEMATAWDKDGNVTKWANAEGKTLQFKKAATAPEGEEILWEPGCTYELPELRVVNHGNLALKYKVVITGIGGDVGLNKVIDWTMNLDGATFVVGSEHKLAAKTAGTVDADVLTIQGRMQETAGNEYQKASIDGISITVYATQDTVESDSFSSDYDENAEYAVATAPVEVTDNKVDAEVTMKSVEKTDDGQHVAEVTIPAGAAVNNGTEKLTLTIVETEKPANFDVESSLGHTTMEVKLEGLAANNTTPVKVEMFVGKGLTSFKLYHSGVLMKAQNSVGAVAEDQDYYYDSATGVVTMLSATFSPFTYTYDKENWSEHAAESYATPVDDTQKVVTIASAEELALFAQQVNGGKNYNGYTMKLTADVDLGDYLWQTINGFGKLQEFTLDGKGHTIRNMVVRSCTNSSGYGTGFIGNTSGTITIKDISFTGADVMFFSDFKQSLYGGYVGNVGGIVLGYTYGTTLFDHVTVTDSIISGYGKIGVLLGMGAEPGVSVTFKDCVSKDNTIHAVYNMGGLAGNIQRGNGVDNGKVEDCTVENITVEYSGTEQYADVSGEATLKSNDLPSGTDTAKTVSGKYWEYADYYWGGYADYYVSYGQGAYDAPVDGYTMRLANSEYCVNK